MAKEPSARQEVVLDSWRDFQEYVHDVFVDEDRVVFRGHRSANWLLESTLSRVFKDNPHLASLDPDERKERVEKHYQEFQYAMRGRRGVHPPKVEGDYLWALGQHFGLATPLLDWATSPYTAAFFAFGDEGHPQTEHRAVFAAKKDELQQRVRSGSDAIYFFSPLSDENPRLVNQGGLFSRLPVLVDLESWIDEHQCDSWSEPVLVKLLIPNGDRDMCLRLTLPPEPSPVVE